MGVFSGELIVKKVGTRLWELNKDFVYFTDKKEEIKVLAGFITDFASVPRVFWVIFPPDGEYTSCAIVHDYLYYKKDRSRLEADNIFLEAMKSIKVNLIKRRIMWLAVRSLGFIPWNMRK